MAVCRRYVRNRMEADDIFQESFIKIFEKIGTLRDVSLADAWVKQIVIRTAINHYEANLKYYKMESADNLKYTQTDDWSILNKLSTDSLFKLIQELPDGYRVIFNLYVIDGFTHPEIAEMLNINEGTSKSQLSKARDYLKKQLQKLGISRYEK